MMIRIVCLALVCIPAWGEAASHAAGVRSHGAKGDGETDDTGALQQALDAAGAAGGGSVFLGPGRYRCEGELTIPANVTLEGIWEAPHRGDPPGGGSVLLAYPGKGDAAGTPFITMNTSSTLKGLLIYYPEQVKANPPAPYPWTIRAAKGGADNVSLIHVTIVNPYQAVDFGTHPAGRHYIDGLYAHALKRGLYINRCYDVGRIENVHFWPFWDTNPESPLWEFTKENGTAFIFGRTDGQMGLNLFSIFYKTGMHFISGGLEEGGGDGLGGGGSGVYTNAYMDLTQEAVRVDAVMQNSGISFVNGMMMSRVIVGRRNRGPVKFTGTGFWAVDGLDSHAKVEGVGTVFFNSCHFSGWDQDEEGAPCLDVNSRRAIIAHNDFDTERRDHIKIRVGARVRAATVIGNLMPGGALIENHSREGASIQIGLNAGSAAP